MNERSNQGELSLFPFLHTQASDYPRHRLFPSPYQWLTNKKGKNRKGDILLFCFGSWASAGSRVNSRRMRSVVVIPVKQILPRCAAVQNVVARPSDGSSCGSWHRAMLPEKPVGKPANRQEECPLLRTLLEKIRVPAGAGRKMLTAVCIMSRLFEENF